MNDVFLLLTRPALVALSVGIAVGGAPFAAHAVDRVDIPGAADAARIRPERKVPLIAQPVSSGITLPKEAPILKVPKGANHVTFELQKVTVDGATAFTPEQLRDIYAPYVGKTISLDAAYAFAAAITKRYRNAGYFLSLAYIAPQKITSGVVTITVVEGYVDTVKLDDAVAHQSVVMEYIDDLKAQRPLTSQQIESFLLRLNDLAGYSFNGVLSANETGDNGAVELTLTRHTKESTARVDVDNYGSRFLGPHQATLSYSTSLFDLQQTSISGLATLPSDELNYVTLNHSITLAPRITAQFVGAYTKARPGFTLEPLDIESESSFLSASLNYQWIRQRQENASVSLTLDSRNSATDILNSQLTHDDIRTMRATASFDATDRWNGYTIISATLSHGIDGLGSSNKDDTNLSREEATPDFTKAELSLARLQGIGEDWSVLATAAFQGASGPLYSAEEFGYGGQQFGRAFDASEISGDHGVAGSVELRYDHWSDWQPVGISPYAFYDAGVVWNDDRTQVSRESGTSAGFGVRAQSPVGLSGAIGLAWPLTRDAQTPIYGQKNNQPRILLQISQSF